MGRLGVAELAAALGNSRTDAAKELIARFEAVEADVSDATERAFTEDLVFDDVVTMTYDGDGSERCVLAIDPAGAHVVGGRMTIIVPADSSLGIDAATALGITLWEAHDPAKDYCVQAECVAVSPARFISSGHVVETDGDAPTIVSATIAAATPTVLTLVMDEKCRVPSIAGLTLTGTSSTISSLTSGDGTTTLVFALSGAVPDGSVVNLVAAASAIRDLNGNVLANVTKHVTLASRALAIPNCVRSYEADIGITSALGLVTIWADADARAGNLTPHPTKTGPTYTANAGDGKPSIDFNGTTDVLSNLVDAMLDMDSDCTFACVVQHAAANDDQAWGYGDTTGGGGKIAERLFQAIAIEGAIVSSTAATATIPARTGLLALTWQYHYIRREGANWYMGLDANAETTIADPGGGFAAVKLLLGASLTAGAAAGFLHGKFRAWAAFNRTLTPTELAALRTSWKAFWPGMP